MQYTAGYRARLSAVDTSEGSWRVARGRIAMMLLQVQRVQAVQSQALSPSGDHEISASLEVFMASWCVAGPSWGVVKQALVLRDQE